MIDLIRHYTVHVVFIESYQPQKQWYVTLCLNRNTCLTYVCTLQAWNLLWIMVALSWPLIFFFLSFLLPYYPLISLLLPVCLCSLDSFLYWSSWPENVALYSPASLIPLSLFHFFCLLPAIRPRLHAGTIQKWQNCTKHWVSEKTIKAPSELCSFSLKPHWAAAARHHCTSTLRALSHSSLRALYFKHLRDSITTVINLQGPICQHCDCLLLSL